MTETKWFYRELADKAGYEIRVPVGWNPPWPVYWSKVDDPAHVPPLDEPIVLPDDLASIVAEEVPAGRPFNFPVHLLDYSRYDFECSPYDVLVAQPGHEPTLLPHGTKVEYLTMNSDEWFYRDLADKAGPEIRVIIAHPLPGPPPGPVYWSKINDPADVQVDPELHRQLHIEAAKRYRAEHGRNYWDPPAFGDGLAAYHQQWEERESAARIEQIVQFRQILFGTRRDG
jgi:hypothetical protein